MQELRVVNGVCVYVTICKPSRRKAGTGIQKARRQKHSKAAWWLAKDKDLRK